MPPDAAPSLQSFLDGYPEAALLVTASGDVVCSNPKGVTLAAMLGESKAAPVSAMIERAAAERAIVNGPVSLNDGGRETVLEISVIPRPAAPGEGGGDVLVLSEDRTMERNLRSALIESRQRYKDLVEVSSDFAWEVDDRGLFCFVSPGGALGFTPDEMVERSPGDFLIHPADGEPVPFLSRWAIEDTEIVMRSANGNEACVSISCLPLIGDRGEWLGTRGICRDVTEERRRDEALRSAQEREYLLGYIVNSIRDELDPLNMLVKAAKATSQALSASGCRIFRRSADGDYVVAAEQGETAGIGGLRDLLEKIGDKVGAQPISIGPWRVLAANAHYRQEVNGGICIWRPLDGGDWDSNHHMLLTDVASQIGIANEQIANHERIVNLSRTDGMTGLLNRRAFLEEEIPRRFKRLHLDGLDAALFYLDLDNFKLVNDVHGHQRGDEALLRLRDLMIEYSRPGDAMVRLGGDEFALWMDGVSEQVMLKRVNSLIEASECLKEYSGDDNHPLGISIGVAMYIHDSGESLDSLYARADAAMYRVKHNGKGGYEVAPPYEKAGGGKR